MSHDAQYSPSAVLAAQVEKTPDKWTLILTRDLHHPPELVWQALTDPAHLREWAPFDADRDLDAAGARVTLTWTGTGNVSATQVIRADAPRLLEYHDLRWQLEPLPGGTRLTLWHSIDRRFIAWGAAGWHISFDVLDRLLAGRPIGRIAGPGAMKFAAWQRLVAEYKKLFGIETARDTSST